MGILSVCAAGNDHHNTDDRLEYPVGSDCPSLLSVAASTREGEPASFSNSSLNGWYSKAFNSTNFTYINLLGVTQFRLRFSKDDNNDFGAVGSGLLQVYVDDTWIDVARYSNTLATRFHRLAERLLMDVLTTEETLLDERACRLEHALLDGLDDHICTLLGHPRFCPHGKLIPEGACCRQKRASVDRLIAPLSELQPDQGGHIAYIQMNNPHHLQKLMAMGVLPGIPITLLRRFPSFVFEAGYSQFAVDEEIATDIYVRLAHDDIFAGHGLRPAQRHPS
jgi:Fe2+ transport system protein FeoA